jgi:diacylglycerol kinase family enzyme
MKITLVHNPGAGDGQNSRNLIRLMSEAGHSVRLASVKDDWKAELRKAADLVAAAGGDGTVRRVALEAAARGLPFAAIPIGTANNIAKSLGLLGDAGELIESWSESPRHAHPFDLGEAIAPWGEARFVEAVGAGLIGALIEREDDVAEHGKFLGREMDRALHLLCELVRDAKPRRWIIEADGEEHSGLWFAVEVLNIRFVGPNLPLAPEAFPGDGKLDLVLLGEKDREALLAYLEDRMHLAAAELPEFRTLTAREFVIQAPAGIRWHLDDRNWPKEALAKSRATVTVRCLPAAATFIAAPKARSPSPSSQPRSDRRPQNTPAPSADGRPARRSRGSGS